MKAQPSPIDESRLRQLAAALSRRAPLDGVVLLERADDALAGAALGRLEPQLAIRILACLSPERSEALAPAIDSAVGDQWTLNLGYGDDTVGRLMEPVPATFSAGDAVGDAVEKLRPFAAERQVVYAFVVDGDGRLEGVVAMRELLFADPSERLADVMVSEPFYFRAEATLEEAMRAVLRRHYPVYPVCDPERRLLGIVRGYALFERHAIEITAQSGRMVGVEKEERLVTPWRTSLRLRHPWLQLNLLTAFAAAAVVGVFESTIASIVALAAFLPVLAGQSGNTGCQALAVTIRGLTLNELKPGMERKLLAKEALLGLANGALVGVVAALGMLVYASLSGAASPYLLAGVVLLAMIGSCVASGVSGVCVPLVLRRLGADPATASAIFLTTATDIASMGLLLGLATALLL